MEKGQYITVKEASRYLGIPLSTTYDLIRAKKIRSIKIGGTIRCLTDDIKNYVRFGTNIASSQDKRRHPRINTEFSCYYSKDLQGHRETNVDGLIVNLSPEGIFMQKQNYEEEMINVDDPVIVRFKLAIGNGEIKDISVNGRVLRKQENGYAVKFRQMDKSLKEAIRQYIG